MNLQQLLEHHQIARNPFSDEDAQTDLVFKDHCIVNTYHPAWDKVYGDPSEPATAIVFGEKGAGKTALRLQIARHLDHYNEQHPRDRLFVIHYDDFNPFLDRFCEKLSRRRKRRADRALASWKLWDHMDAILSLGVTGLVDQILQVKQPSKAANCKINQGDVEHLDRPQSRDLLLLAACYDQSMAEHFKDRWRRLRGKLRFRTFRAHWPTALGGLVTLATTILVILLAVKGQWPLLQRFWIYPLLAAAGWTPWLWKFWKSFKLAQGVIWRMRIGNRQRKPLIQVLMNFTEADLASQPLPNKDRTDDRYELLCKFQGILNTLGYSGIVVLVDRLDEPHLINGSAELMKALLWPMLDNKFLKHPGMGLKLMLPIELTRFIEREDRDFYQRARLDKQNTISSFQWTGEALYDVANARLQACAVEGASPVLNDLLDNSLSEQRLLETMRTLRTPRHLFKFLYRLLVDHCNGHIDREPVWKISAATFESTLAVFLREQDAFDRGMGAG